VTRRPPLVGANISDRNPGTRGPISGIGPSVPVRQLVRHPCGLRADAGDRDRAGAGLGRGQYYALSVPTRSAKATMLAS
jgi:hypothetical protein